MPPVFKWKYRAGAGAKIRKIVEPELESKINHFSSPTLRVLLTGTNWVSGYPATGNGYGTYDVT